MTPPNKLANPKSKLTVRTAEIADAPGISALSVRTYGEEEMYPEEMIIGQINVFPQGQIVALVDDTVVGYCATFRIGESVARKPHTWDEIAGGG